MSWNQATGSEVMGDVINSVQLYERDELTRQRIYHVLICDFENRGADTLHECLGLDPAFDRAWGETHEGGGVDP